MPITLYGYDIVNDAERKPGAFTEIPSQCVICVITDNEGKKKGQIQIRISEDGIELYKSQFIDDTILIRPRSLNVINVL